MYDNARWVDLACLKIGAMVVFEAEWDIFPHGMVPRGTRAVVTSQKLPKAHPELPGSHIRVTPVTPVPGLDLAEWGGAVHVTPHICDGAGNYAKPNPYGMSPLRIA